MQKRTTRVRIAHINDTHSYFEPTTVQLDLDIQGQAHKPYVSVGGFARIKSRADQLKAQAKNQQRDFMFLHAGDCFQGTLYFSLFKGKANSDMLNRLDLTAMTLGNHELDIGNGPVAEFAKDINFPLLCGNWDLSNEDVSKAHRLTGTSSLRPYNNETKAAHWLVQEVGEEKIAIFGLSIDKMADIANPDPDTPFVNALETAQRTVACIQAEGINKIILLSHLGYDSDLELAEQVSGISLIIGGHSHVLQGDFSDLGINCKGEYGVRVRDTYIVQAGMHAQAIGHCDIDFDESGQVIHFSGKNELLIGRRLCLDASMTECDCEGEYEQVAAYLSEHPNVVRCAKDLSVHHYLYDTYRPAVFELQTALVGHLAEGLRHVRIPDEQGSSEICPLVAESFYTTMRTQGFDVDFAIHNAGGVRCSLNPGPISKADIAGKLLPFAVPIGVYQIKGKYLKPILEGAIDNALDPKGTGTGSYPYSFNLSYQVDLNAPKGERVQELKLFEHGEWQEIDRDRVYCGTSSAYTMKGKEGYLAILNLEPGATVTETTMSDCFIQMMYEQPHRFESQIKLGLKQENA